MTTTKGNTMNIDNLTYGELKQIATLFAAQTASHADQFVGKYVICRCESAGVHAGELVSQAGDVVVLKDSRRLWCWSAKDGIALSGVAQNGIRKERSKIDTPNPLIRLTGVIETIIASNAARESINDG